MPEGLKKIYGGEWSSVKKESHFNQVKKQVGSIMTL